MDKKDIDNSKKLGPKIACIYLIIRNLKKKQTKNLLSF